MTTSRTSPRLDRLRGLPAADLAAYVADNGLHLAEDEALAILENRFVTPKICQLLAQNPRLSAYYLVRLRLVAHRQTPLPHALKLVHYLYWPDLVRLSIEMTVPAQVRRAIDTVLLSRVTKLSLGEKVATAKRCSSALVKVFLFDRDPKVFAALLVNQRLREDDLLELIGSDEATTDQLLMIAGDRRWASRYPIRKALVLNASTPRSVAASQLRFLSRRDLRDIHQNPSTSVYLRRCIEASARLEIPGRASPAEDLQSSDDNSAEE